MRGTRGFVTTTELSTGSVGDSSAPSRKLSVQPRSVSRCVDQRPRARPVSGMASARFRSGRCQSCRSASSSTSSPSRNRIRISATTARPWTNSDVASKSSAPKPACAEQQPREHETGREGEEAALGQAGHERAEHEQHPERRERRVQEPHSRGEGQRQGSARAGAASGVTMVTRAVSANWPRRNKISARSRSSSGASFGSRSAAAASKDGCRAGSGARCSPSSS